MKRLLSLVLIITTNASFGQSVTSLKTFINSTGKSIGTSKSAEKTTNTYWRIAATANYADFGGGFTLFDSSSYQYSNARGSSINMNNSNLDIQDNGFESLILSDTTTNYEDNGSGLELADRSINTYDGKNLRSGIVSQVVNPSSQLENEFKEVVVRDGSDRITKKYIMRWMNSAWDTVRIVNMVYNANGKIVLDSSYTTVGNNEPFSRTSYTYDMSGNLTEMLSLLWNIQTSMWDSSAQDIINHVSSQSSVTTTKYGISGKLMNYYWDSVAYDNNGNYTYSLIKEWDTTAKKWYNSTLETRTIVNDKPTVASFSEYDTMAKKWEKIYDGDFAYNNNGDLDNITVFAYFNGIKLPTPQAMIQVYYEHYFNVGVDEVKNDRQVLVYPNPATDVLHVATNGNTLTAVRLTNMTGQVVYNAEMTGEQLLIPVSGLAAGNYILSIGDTRKLVTVK